MFKKNFQQKFPEKRIPEKIHESPQKSLKILPRKIPDKFPKTSQDFENIQFSTSHLEAENPFGLVFMKHECRENLSLMPNL